MHHLTCITGSTSPFGHPAVGAMSTKFREAVEAVTGRTVTAGGGVRLGADR